MNINDVLIRVLKKNDEISEQILHRNEEDEAKHTQEIKALEARDREIAEKFQDQEWEISKLEQLKQLEIDREAEDERWHSNELKKIEKESNERKAELERLRAAARELKEASRLKEAQEEEIARLKQTLAAKENNRRNNKTRARSSERNTRSSRQEVEVYEEEDGEWEGNLIVEGASEEEEEFEQPVRRSSKARRNVSGSPKRRLVPVDDSTDEDGEDLQSMRSSRLGPSRRNLSSASLPEEDFLSMRSAKARMARRNLSSASLRVHETEDDYTETDEEDNYAPSPPKKIPKGKRKPQSSSGTLPREVDDLMAQLQGFTPIGNHRSRSRGGSNSRSGSPIYNIPGVHSNPYFPTYGDSFPPPIGPYGLGIGMPGSIVNSSVGNIVNSTISNVGNDNSVRKVYRK